MKETNELTYETLTRTAPPRGVYTPAEVARLLRVSPRTVLNWIHTGRLDAIKLSPRVYRIMIGALVKMLFPERIRHLPVKRTGRIRRFGQGETWMKRTKRKVPA